MSKETILPGSRSYCVLPAQATATLFLLLTTLSSVYCVRSNEELEINFFNAIATLKFDLEDVIAMYENVTAQVQTAGCQEKCRTPLALWVIHNIVPCRKMEKTDCPKGLVCCYQEELYPYETGPIIVEDKETSYSNHLSPSHSVVAVPKNFVQDKIPDDSDENF